MVRNLNVSRPSYCILYGGGYNIYTQTQQHDRRQRWHNSKRVPVVFVFSLGICDGIQLETKLRSVTSDRRLALPPA